MLCPVHAHNPHARPRVVCCASVRMSCQIDSQSILDVGWVADLDKECVAAGRAVLRHRQLRIDLHISETQSGSNTD